MSIRKDHHLVKAILAYLAFVAVTIAFFGIAGAWVYARLPTIFDIFEESPRSVFSDVELAKLASDAHVIVGNVPLVLPLIALPGYVSQGPSFSLDKDQDHREAKERFEAFRAIVAYPQTAPTLPRLDVSVNAYGSDDFGTGIGGVCARLGRQWSKSVCKNPRAALEQALPQGTFSLVDLSALYGSTRTNAGNCASPSEDDKPLSLESGEAVLLCKASVFRSGKAHDYTAVVGIDGNLGALWTVWESDETASEMARREGKAIVAFVADALGPVEDFASLHEAACALRRPNSRTAPSGPDC